MSFFLGFNHMKLFPSSDLVFRMNFSLWGLLIIGKMLVRLDVLRLNYTELVTF